ncbi:MAG TPA: tetratricopeptide repeat protein [Pyrinomonadaceae bacterium]|nr:tetratricopeptide repeat protein [Pyrinomonadaceae bacterium]
MKKISIFVLIFIFSINSAAQNNERSPLDPTRWGVVYDIPATKNVRVKTDVPYSGNLKIDVYSPPNAKTGDKLPAVVFLNAIGDRPDDKVKNWEIYKSFPRLVAAHGMIGISMEADGERIQENLRALFEFLARDGAQHGIDGTRLGIYAASANVTQTSRFLLAENAAPNVKAAVLYYGGAPETSAKLRTDLPVLFILAESDAPRLQQQMANLWQRVMEAKAPWTLMYASRMPHAFDAFEDSDESRRIIQQTIAFWKSHLEPVPQPDWKKSNERAIVAAIYANDAQKAVELLSKYLAENPADPVAQIQYGRMLQQLQRFDEAVSSFEKASKLQPNEPAIYSGIGQIRFAQKRYEEAIPNLQKAIENGFRSSLMYGQLGYSQLVLNRNEEAIKTYEKAFEAGIPPGANTRGMAYYNMACAYVRLKQNDKAFEMLNKTVDEGFTNRQTFETDTDLAPLRTDARFQALLKRLPQN